MPGAIYFCTPEKARSAAPASGWIYLGKSIKSRAALERGLGRRPLSLKGLFHDEARALKQPFLDLVERLGRRQADQESWWAGTLSWKDAGASDLFLLACYQALCRRLSLAPGLLGVRELTVVVEDPWLFAQLKSSLRAPGVSFLGAASLRLCRAKALGLALARRLRWVLRMAKSRVLQSWHSRDRAWAPRGGVAIYSHLLARSLDGEVEWVDHYLPGLEEKLREVLPVERFTNPDLTGFERELGRRSKTITPLILYASWRGLLRALFSLPAAAASSIDLDGLPMDLLLVREWWHDLSRPGRCAYLLFYDCARNYLRAASWKAVVFPWENQPHERMLRLAAQDGGMRLIGHQHTTVPSLQLPFFLGSGEAGWAPLPDLIITSGPHPHELLVRGGYPPRRLLLGGSRRYARLKPAAFSDSSAVDALILLPIDFAVATHLLGALARAYPLGGRNFSFRVKTHPADPLDFTKCGFRAWGAAQVLEEALQGCKAAVFSASTSGLEAMLSGHPALRYRPEALLDLDPCEMIQDGELPTAGDEDLGRKLEAVLAAKAGLGPERTAAILVRLFSPVDEAAWLNAIAAGS